MLALAGVAALAGAELRAGAARVAITPRGSIWLAGRNHASDSIESEIYARALALDDGAGGRAVLIATDLAGLPRSLTERVAADIMKAQGLERSQIVFNSSHTYNTPFIKGLQPGLEPANAIELRKIDQYSEALARYLAEVAAVALADLKPARIGFGTGRVAFAMNELAKAGRGVPQNAGSAAEAGADAVPVLRVLTPKGGVIAVLFGYVIDNTTLDEGPYAIDGGYAGAAEVALEKRYPGSIALFYGLCGPGGGLQQDETIEVMKQRGAALADEVARLMQSALTPVKGRLKSALIETALPFVTHTEEPGEARGEMRQLPYAVQVLRFDAGFTLVALGGEGTPELPGEIRKLLHNNEIVVAAGAGDAAAAGSGGGEAEERVLDAVGRAWKRAGRR
jgi:hypothetical protein